MPRTPRFARAFGVATLLLLGALIAAGCQSIVGIENRTYQPGSQLCQEYCNTVQKNCTGNNAVYTSKASCMAVCANLTPGDPNSAANDDTVACRLRYATNAASSPGENCADASPGGFKECGSDCASYCALFSAICKKDFNIVSDCEAKCSAFGTTNGYSAVTDATGDTVECRLAHLALAAPTHDSVECGRASFQATDTCKNTGPANCAAYCSAVMVACTGGLQQYISKQECLAVCADLPKLGTFADEKGNSVGCRYFHSFNAMSGPVEHCPHSGPGGDGQCSTDNCESYCDLLQKGCNTAFTARYPGTNALSTCRKDCLANIPGGDPGKLYSGNSSPSKMVTCLADLSKAIYDKSATECLALQGNGC